MTRTCPVCGTSYPDEAFFCGHDGTITIQDQDPADHDPRLGKQLGGYIVVARVADGAMGRVFEGRHPQTRARVAIKVLHADVVQDEVAVERFKREFETAMEMNHPNVVSVLEFGETPDGSYFMTMEYLVGEELGKVLATGRAMQPARILRIVCQVARALDYAHSFGFVHRDLKPDNIFLCSTDAGDDVRLLDFGSVKLQVAMGQKLTAVGTTVGSPFYMSPEQAMGKADVDQRTDVFALGAILYEMATGAIAFEAQTVAKILMRIMNDSPTPPTQLHASLPQTLDDVLSCALAKAKGDRPGTASELARMLLRAYGLAGSVEHWAGQPQAAIEAALQPRPVADEPPSTAPSAHSPTARVPDAGSGERARGDTTRPRLGLSTFDQLAVPMRPAAAGARIALWVLGLALIVGVIALLIQ